LVASEQAAKASSKGHRGRLRDRFLDKGLAGFTDTEILEMLLSFGTPRSNCREQARELLKRFGSFSGVLDASPASLQKVRGVGPKNAFALSFMQAVASHYLRERLRGRQYLTSSKEVAAYLTHSMRGLKKEVFTVIFLDSSHAILDSRIVAQGTINVNTIYPRELVKLALEYHAAALVVAHNHPSGSLKPSSKDIHLTRTLYLLCHSMQLQLLDHLLIGDGVYSFADHGHIENARTKTAQMLATLYE
jgi:DNA repair protein RadC